MLETFSDDEIVGELLATGYLYPADPLDDRRIENAYVGRTVVKYIHTLKGSGERHTEPYRNLKELLLCECLTFDDLRKDWRYHGVLLESPTFRERTR